MKLRTHIVQFDYYYYHIHLRKGTKIHSAGAWFQF